MRVYCLVTNGNLYLRFLFLKTIMWIMLQSLSFLFLIVKAKRFTVIQFFVFFVFFFGKITYRYNLNLVNSFVSKFYIKYYLSVFANNSHSLLTLLSKRCVYFNHFGRFCLDWGRSYMNFLDFLKSCFILYIVEFCKNANNIWEFIYINFDQ